MGAGSMYDRLTGTLRSPWAAGAPFALALLVLLPPTPGAAQRLLADAFPPGHPSCHALMLSAAQRAEPERRVTNIVIERNARDIATERKWAAREQFDDTPVVSATMRVRFRGDQA